MVKSMLSGVDLPVKTNRMGKNGSQRRGKKSGEVSAIHGDIFYCQLTWHIDIMVYIYTRDIEL